MLEGSDAEWILEEREFVLESTRTVGLLAGKLSSGFTCKSRNKQHQFRPVWDELLLQCAGECA